MSDKSKFKKWFNDELILIPGETTDHDIAKQTWDACKNMILEELEGFEGEYVCDILDKIKNV